MSNFVPSTYQVEIDRVFVHEPDVNILIAAVAGSGKTTTLLQLLKKVKGDALFLAFNKSIVDELEEKVGFIPRVKIKTLHALGMGRIIGTFGKQKLDDNKTVNFCFKLFDHWGFKKDKQGKLPKEWWEAVYAIKDLYNLYRLKVCRTGEDLIQVCDNLGVEWDKPLISKVLEIHEVLSEYNRNPKEIDFTDMVYLPATDSRITFKSPSVTFIDECQDLNEAQHLMIDRVIGTNRFVACGDRSQSIYGFSGADSQSFDRFLVKPNVRELPLSVCYRCGSDIVQHANTVYNIMEPFEGNPTGLVEKDGDVMDAEDGDMIICRNTAPLVKTYFQFLKARKSAYIKGKDIGRNLINLVSKFNSQTSQQLMEKLKEKAELIEQELKESGIENPKKHPKYVSFDEKVEIIQIFANKYYTVREIQITLEEMFKDSSKGVILSTIHKSKGLESDTIFFMDENLLPSKYANTEDQMKQEENLRYVAITRAKRKLIYCSSNI